MKNGETLNNSHPPITDIVVIKPSPAFLFDYLERLVAAGALHLY